jgi:hypothetical protein
VDDFTNQSADWLQHRIENETEVELELGVLVAAASDWTEDEMELDDLVSGLIESGSVQLQIG